jgi:hypothetical protein
LCLLFKNGNKQSKYGINAITIGDNSPHIAEASLDKDAILTIKGSDEQFIPIQQILNNKVKMNFQDNPIQAGNFRVYKKEWIENISFNTIEPKVIWLQPMKM